MLDLQSKTDIEKISLDLLKQSKSYGIFPTQVDNIVKYSELFVDESINLSKIDHSYLSIISDEIAYSIQNAIELVRGVFDRREKVIYLDLEQSKNRQNFVKLHEVGHHVLDWQNKILENLDDDITLSPLVEEEFESEANYFASITLFQHDRFVHEMKKLELSIQSSIYLSKFFGASIHATLRRFVECSQKRCALLVLKDILYNGISPRCSKRDYFQSNKFTDSFGNIEFPEHLGYTWSFVKDYYHKKKFNQNGFITLETKNGQVGFNYHFFNNSYNAFVFIFPIGEKNKTRTKFIITNP
jgi:Zn-dependent peptidase ImmA (M78 family)